MAQMSKRRSKPAKTVAVARRGRSAWTWVAIVALAGAGVLALVYDASATSGRCAINRAVVNGADVDAISPDRREHASAARTRARRHGLDSRR